ncbi:MAG: type IV pilus assembly protein PilM [Proteobacteria bacterium]|nr:type IV pilus assembly protein PilM [Pseudomonadota bacterium]
MGLFGWGGVTESMLGIDIGFSGIKLVEFDPKARKITAKTIAYAPLDADIFSGYSISNPARVGEELSRLLETHQITTRKAATALPAASVFTKRIKIPKAPRDELAAIVRLEAANVIPHKIDAVRMDYHLLGESARNQLDVLVVAAKSELVASFQEAILAADVDVVVVDVDTFALQNLFEMGAEQGLRSKPVALLNIGARYTAVSICQEGRSLFTGDIPCGGRSITEGVANELSISNQEAEEYKRADVLEPQVLSAFQQQFDRIASEINRQLGLFWNATGVKEPIAHILLSGGASASEGIIQNLRLKTGIPCERLNPLQGIELTPQAAAVLPRQYIPSMSIAVALAARQPGDKIFPPGV